MYNKFTILLFSICIVIFSCSKGSKQPAPQNSNSNAVKITLVSGSGQTDTIGRQVSAAVIVKVTQNGTPLSGYGVSFQGSGCNADLIYTFQTAADGTCGLNWRLASDVGPQTLKVFALNPQNKKVDSVTATATGVAPGPGLHYSACTPFGAIPSIFCKLSTGRLFTSFYNGKNYLRYSDDNGISWNPVLSLGNSHVVLDVVSTSTDGLIAFTQSEGSFYSTDGGQTWATLSSQPFNNIEAVVCTPGGKLIVTTQFNSVYVSLDYGKTWTTPSASSFIAPNSTSPDTGFGSPAEDKNGNLYVAGQESQTLYKSSDNGKSWTIVSKANGEADFAIYVDNNNWFYKSRSDYYGGVYISKDNGVTYTLTSITSANSFIENMSVQSDGNFYYDFLTSGLYMTNSVGSTLKHLDDNETSSPTPYIVAKNNNIVYADPSSGLIYYYSK